MLLTTSFQKVTERSAQVTSNTVGYSRLYLKYGRTEYDIANNRDTIYYEIRQYSYNQYGRYLGWEVTNSSAWNIKIAGSTVASGSYTQTAIYSNDPELVRVSGSFTQSHDSDGTWAETVEMTGPIYLTQYTDSASISLPDIPRASVPTASNGTIGSALTINTNRASSNFLHALKATFGGTTDTIATNVGDSYSWTPSLSLQNRIPNATSGSCVITCETYSNGNLIGTKTVTITLSINTASCTPTLTGSYADLNTAITAVTGSNQTMISGLSNVQVTATPSLKYGATIASVWIGGVNVTSGGSPYRRTINAVTAASYVVEVYDSRGFYVSATVTLSYVSYSRITFLASFFRTAAMNNEIALQYSGTFYNHTIGATTNTLTAKYRYQPELGDWSEWVTLTPTIAGDNYSNAGEQIIIGTNFDHNKQYRFEIVFTDAIDTKTNTIIVKAGRHILKVTEAVQVLQGKLHIQKLYTKNDKDFVFDFVYDVLTRTWVTHVYGLTQMFEPQHVFQSDVNTRSIITVLNTGDYPLLKYTIDDSAGNFVDYENINTEAVFNNHTLLDTGICPLDDILDKRARELQFVTNNTTGKALEFFVTVYVDSTNVSNPDTTLIDWISDPDDPNYGQLYEIEEEVANVYGDTSLDAWVIDYSHFPKTGLVKSHLRLHGKGLYFRAIIVNRDKIEHELSSITWVYRIMNAR